MSLSSVNHFLMFPKCCTNVISQVGSKSESFWCWFDQHELGQLVLTRSPRVGPGQRELDSLMSCSRFVGCPLFVFDRVKSVFVSLNDLTKEKWI